MTINEFAIFFLAGGNSARSIDLNLLISKIYRYMELQSGPEVVPCRSQLTIMLLTIEHRFDGLECTNPHKDAF